MINYWTESEANAKLIFLIGKAEEKIYIKKILRNCIRRINAKFKKRKRQAKRRLMKTGKRLNGLIRF